MSAQTKAWHPGAEIPPLHRKKWTDDDGFVHHMKMSDWMLVQDDTCDPEYTGPVVVARYEQEGTSGGWMTGNGRCGTVVRWHKMPKLPEAQHD